MHCRLWMRSDAVIHILAADNAGVGHAHVGLKAPLLT